MAVACTAEEIERMLAFPSEMGTAQQGVGASGGHEPASASVAPTREGFRGKTTRLSPWDTAHQRHSGGWATAMDGR